ncbi:hypothetical protein EIP91_012322 [Steccherinum ochraceum]|uniref:GATA-type domain-containing protein n=1 Tax=Steccherinum ochraceum TaxID=92696 RepID=A0A4V2MWT3_9APHY|nr:hypothetical protein EIP91_012322 [Steccherinum ochraceum]
MDAVQFDYTSYSDASTPRTPSPRTSICSEEVRVPYPSPHHYKHQLDVHVAVPRIFDHHHQEEGIVPETHALESAHMWNAANQFSYPNPPSSRGSLLDELYDHELPEHSVPHDVYVDHHHTPNHHHSADPQYHAGNWSSIPQSAHGDHHIPQPMRHVHDIAMQRRATFPYVRHDRPEPLPYPNHPFMPSDQDSLSGSPYSSRPGTVYGEPLSMDGSPHFSHHHMDEPFAHSVPMSSPHAMYDHLDGIKTEDSVLPIVPSQTAYGRPPSAGMHPLPCLSPHAGLLVQHTDDAASKETQYLRRRCFNCHTTEPPSWRRSTLNPGKIVCNKCGLYERTHLRPRPLRFDELRAGSKTRKQPKVNGGSPKVGKSPHMVKKEPRDGEPEPLQRRGSVSSQSASSVGGGSDWDDNVSTYSGSAPPSSFNSPAVSSFSIPRDPNSQSPQLLPRDGGIRLPNAPLSDIASLQQPQSPPMNAAMPPTPRKSATAPTPFFQGTAGGNEFFRRDSAAQDVPMPAAEVVAGWQSVPLTDLAPTDANGAAVTKARSNSLQKPVAA